MQKITSQETQEIGDELGIDWANVSLTEFTIGINIEFEHGTRFPQTNVTDDNLLLTGKIAWAHLMEYPDYYTRLCIMEKEAELFWSQQKSAS